MLNSVLAWQDQTMLHKAVLRQYQAVPDHGEVKASEYLAQIAGALRELNAISLPSRKERYQRLAQLIGTSVVEGFYICEQLHRVAAVSGSICEFGVAQGATSALLASEILETDRALWLYDSFEGLPAPGEKDLLINDIFQLGSIERYQGTMRSPITEVQTPLVEVQFPPDRCHIVKGFFDNAPTTPGPETIAFAYVDFDFYQPILDALHFVNDRMPPGGCVVVDDYGWFSAGAQTAVDEFVAAYRESWQFELPYEFCGKFCILTKTD